MVEKRHGGRGSYEGGGQPDDEGPHEGGEPQGPGNPDADPVRIHREFVERRIGGGAQPTPEKYRQALEQWNALPGSLRMPPIEPTREEDPEPPDTEGGDEPPQRPAP